MATIQFKVIVNVYPGVRGKQGNSVGEQHTHRGWGQAAGEAREAEWGLAVPENLECQSAGAVLTALGTAGFPSHPGLGHKTSV